MRGGWIDHQKHTFDVLVTCVFVPVRVPVPYMEDIKYQRFYIKEIIILMLEEEETSSYTYSDHEACTTTNENASHYRCQKLSHNNITWGK